MNSKRLHFAMIGLTVVLTLLTVGATVLGDAMLKKQSDKLVEAKLENQLLDTQQASLLLAKDDLEKFSELSDIAKQIVPSDKDQAKTTRELVKIAEQSGINIATITFPQSNLGEKKAPVAAPTEGEQTEAAPAPPTSSISQAEPSKGIPGLYELQITLTSSAGQPATYNQLIDFLERLENNRRTSHVTALSITPDANNNSTVSFSITLTVYIKP